MSKWKPIETAPKNGLPILGTDCVTYFVISWMKVDFSYDWYILCEGGPGKYEVAVSYAYPECTILADYSPTHWMPLPICLKSKVLKDELDADNN